MPKQIWKALDDLSPSQIKLRNLPRQPDGLHNMHINEYGQLVKRKGYALYDEISSSSPKIVGMHRYYKRNDDKIFLVALNEGIYNLPDDLSAAVLIKSVTASSDTYFADFDNHSYFVNGVDGVFKCTYDDEIAGTRNSTTFTRGSGTWVVDVLIGGFVFSYINNDAADGKWTEIEDNDATTITVASGTLFTGANRIKILTVRNVGMTVPDAPSENTKITGALGIGIYYFKVTYVDVGGYESNGSDASAAVTIANDTDDGVTLNIPSANIDAVTFVGTGQNDATSGGVFSADTTKSYKVEIDGVGSPNTFKWNDGGSWTTGVQIDTNAQSLGNGVTITFASTTGHTTTEYWTFSATIDPKITKRRIYRTAVGGAIYYYDGEVDNNTTNTYDSQIADTALGTVLKTNHNAPEGTSHLITKRRNKLYLAYRDYLYPSHTSDVEYFPPLWRLRTGNSQKIMGLLEQLTALPITTFDSIERLVGTDEDNFELRNSYSTEGCLAMRSYVNCDNLLVYLGFNGINYFDGTTSGVFSEALNKYIRENIVDAYRHLSCATYWDNKYILCYPKKEHSKTYPTETVWYDLKNKTYGVYSFDFSCFSLWDKGTDGLKLKGGDNTKGRVYSVFSGLDDVGTAITAYDRIEPLDMGYPERWKQFYNFYIKVKTKDGLITSSGLAIGTTTDRVANDAFDYAINGTEYSKTAIVAGTEPLDDVIPANKYGAVAFDIGTNETIDVIEATGNSTGFASAALAIAAIPVVAVNHVRMGTVTVIKSDGSFTFGTTALSADNVTVVYTNNLGIAMKMYYTLDDNEEDSQDVILTANTTKWYKVDLVGGGQRARAISPRPYISDKYDFTSMGYAVVFETEAPEY